MLSYRLFTSPVLWLKTPEKRWARTAGKLTLVADLGTFLVETDTRTSGELTPEEAALYECVRLEGRDISAYLVDGEFSFADLERRLTNDGEGHSNLDLTQVYPSFLHALSAGAQARGSANQKLHFQTIF